MSVTISGDTGLAGAATGALNGTLGGTTPSTVVATTITGSGQLIINGIADGITTNSASGVSKRANIITNGTNSASSQLSGYFGINIFDTTDTLQIATGSGSGIKIDLAGNVGIGVSPTVKLDIAGAVQSTGNNKVKGDSSAVMVRNTANAGGGQISVVNAWNANADVTNMAIGAISALKFFVNNSVTESMTLDTSGNLLVGTTAALASASLGKFNVQATTGVSAIYASNSASFASAVVQIGCGTNSGTGWNILEGYSANGGADQFAVKRFQIIGNGNVQNTNNSYGAISDIKLKENIVDTSPKLDKLLQVKIRNYNLKTDPDHKQIGVIAQELETIFPSLIEETEDKETVTKTREVDGVEEEYTEQVPTGETTKAVKYSVFVPILIKAIQEQQALITQLTARLEVLEAK
jgi:hypothetical protein